VLSGWYLNENCDAMIIAKLWQWAWVSASCEWGDGERGREGKEEGSKKGWFESRASIQVAAGPDA
jgi:hypothetical protein